MATTRRNYRNAILGLAVAGALAWGVWWFVRGGWYAEVVLLQPTGTGLSLTIDGKHASPASVREVGDVTCLTFHPPIGSHRFLVRDGESVLIKRSADLESQSVTTYVLFYGGGRWLTEHRIEYGYPNRPDFSAFDTGPQTFSGWATEVDGQEVSFLSRTDDAAGMALTESLGTRVHTQASFLAYSSRALLLPFEDVPDSVMVKGNATTLTQIRVLSLGDVSVAERLRAAAVEDERQRAEANKAAGAN